VIKSGQVGNAAVQHNVRLMRPPEPEFSSSSCSSTADTRAFLASVSSESYDRYHDYGYQVREQEILENFISIMHEAMGGADEPTAS
jgi:hypothetical protein